MSDALFKSNGNGQQAMLLSRIKRSDGSIPYLRRTNQVASVSNVQAPIQSGVNPFQGSQLSSGQVNPSTGLEQVGNTYPFYVQGNIGFSATTSSITLFWDGTNGSLPLVIKRVDGSSFSIVKGSLTINSLQSGTIYGFLPFNCTTNQNNLSFCTGDAGTPRFAFSPNASLDLKAAQNQIQNLSSNEAITTSFIYFTTASSGAVTGDGSPGVLNPYSQRRDAPDEIPGVPV